MHFLYIFAAVLPAILILLYAYKQDFFPEPPKIVFKTFLFGCATVLAVYLFIDVLDDYSEKNFTGETYYFFDSFIRAAFLEEMMKFFVIIFYCLHLDDFDEPMDALVYGVAASLGFAVIENWEYVLGASKDGFEVAKDVALIRSFTAVPLHALAGVFMGFFLMDAVFQKHNKKFFLFLSLFFPVCLHGLYNLILFSKNISDFYVYILLIIFLIRAIFIFKKERQTQTSEIKRIKVIPKTSDIIFVVSITLVLLFAANYFLDYVLYG